MDGVSLAQNQEQHHELQKVGQTQIYHFFLILKHPLVHLIFYNYFLRLHFLEQQQVSIRTQGSKDF